MGRPNKKGGRVTPKGTGQPCRTRTLMTGKAKPHLFTSTKTVNGEAKSICSWCEKEKP